MRAGLSPSISDASVEQYSIGFANSFRMFFLRRRIGVKKRFILNLFTLPKVEHSQIEMRKVFHIPSYERELMMNGHSGDLGGCGGPACAIAISHESSL